VEETKTQRRQVENMNNYKSRQVLPADGACQEKEDSSVMIRAMIGTTIR
jgi:hypothetical protein